MPADILLQDLPEGAERQYPCRIEAFWDKQPQQFKKKTGNEKASWSETYQDVMRVFNRYLAAFLFLFNLHVVCLAALACLAVWLCSSSVWNIR